MPRIVAALLRARISLFALVLLSIPVTSFADMTVYDWNTLKETKEDAYNDCVENLHHHDLVGHSNYVNHGCSLGVDPRFGQEAWVGFAEWDSSYYGPIDMYGYSRWAGECPAGEYWDDSSHTCTTGVFHVNMWGSYHSTHAQAMSECNRKMVEVAPIHNTNYVGHECHDSVDENGSPLVEVTAEWDSYYYGHVIGHGKDYYSEPYTPPPPGDSNTGASNDNMCNPINTATGNKYQRESDFVGTDLLSFERHYNSAESAPSHLLGRNWSDTYNRRVSTVDATRVVVWRADGVGHLFTLTNGVWTPPSGVLTKLTRLVDGGGNPTGWTYKEEDDRQVENFDVLGRLTSIVRSNGEQVTLVYNFGFIESSANDYLPTSITDQGGRTLSLTYTNFRLSQLIDPTGAVYGYAYDSAGRLSVVTYPGGASKTYLYENSSWPNALTGIVDEKNQRFATFGYQSDGRAVSTEHASGALECSMAYNADGTTSITKPNGVVQLRTFSQSTSVTHTASITEVANGQTRTTSKSFDVNGLVDLITDPKGVTADHDFNARGLETQLVESANQAATKRTTQTDWDAIFNVPRELRILNASGALEAKSSYTYNARGQALTATKVNLADATKSRTSAVTYCEQAGVDAGSCPRIGLVLSVNGPRTDITDITSFTYYPSDDASCASAPAACPHRKGDLWKVTNAKGQVSETLKYDGAGRPLSVKDANGVVTDLEYSPRGWLSARKVRGSDNAIEADDAITRLEYDSTGAVTTVTQPDGVFLVFSYDGAHRLFEVTDVQGNKIHYYLDNAGNRFREDTKNAGETVKRTLSRVYDTLGQLKTLADANATPTDFTYDLNGKLDTTTDPLLRVIDNDVDPLGRLIQTIANKNGGTSDRAVTQFQYDARDNLRTLVDPKGLTTNYSYDSLNNLSQLSSPDTGTTIYSYDTAGNVIGQLDAGSQTTGYVYDALNRLTAQTLPHSVQNVYFDYDVTQADCAAGETYSVGRLTRIRDASGSTRYCYDARGHRVRQVQTVTQGTTLTLGTTYNAADRLVSMTYPSGAVVSYLRDENGRVKRVDAQPSLGAAQVTLVSNVSYLPFGPLNTLTFGASPTGRVLTKSYDQNYGIDSVVDSAASNPLSEDFTLNPVGNVTGLTERISATANPLSRTYTYDGLDRLTAQKSGGSTLEGFAYNSTGDRLSKTAGTTTSYTYPSNSHWLTAVGSTTRTYKPTGETSLIGKASTGKVFTYDDKHRMATVSDGNKLAATNLYNGRGTRVAKITSVVANKRQFVYDEAGHLLGEYTISGARVKEYVWLDDTLVAVLSSFDGSTYQFVETDHLGSPRAIVHPSKNVIAWRWDANPTAFGEHAPNVNPDGDSLKYDLNLRFPGQYFDAEDGLNYNYYRDYDSSTGRYIESDPMGLLAGPSLYGYANSRPVTLADPSGLYTWKGDVETFSAGKFVGELAYLEFNLTSVECKDGYRLKLKLNVSAGGVGLGLPTITKQNVTISDDFDPTPGASSLQFEDIADIVFQDSNFFGMGGGLTLGSFDLSYDKYQIGMGRFAVSTDTSGQHGFQAGGSIMFGHVTIDGKPQRIPCDCNH